MRKRLVIPSIFDALDSVVDETEAFFEQHISDEEIIYRIVLLTTEAVTNAIEHGNNLSKTKSVTIEFLAHAQTLEVQVSDEGEGFDRNAIENPLDEDNLLHDGGRGIFLIEKMADKVCYKNGGRKICLTFNRKVA